MIGQKWWNRLSGGSETVPKVDDQAEPAQPAQPVAEPESAVSGDSPIRSPADDAFGIDPFARTIARSIARADARDGLVYAVNGAWGSGKSSAINLILHHLQHDLSARNLVPTMFNPWWFSGSEALTLSFFQELRATVGKSLSETARETPANLGGRLSPAGPLLGAIAGAAATPAAGVVVSGAVSWFEKLTRMENTVEQEHRKLSAALAGQENKFLIVLDDIDRLNTDDALQVFKLIKSVGRLPNVIYLLAYDRHLAEKMVAERFPAEGASYLEKVVQGAFDLPAPDADDLKAQLLMTVEKVMGSPPDEKMGRFWNLFHDVVAPLLKTPRDVVRLSNAITVTWPAVKDDADRADFLAIEALRLFMPEVHKAIRANPEMVTGLRSNHGSQNETRQRYEAVFIENIPAREREATKIALRRLFPCFDSIWGNMYYSSDDRWRRDRLVCVAEHFPTYFAFTVVNEGITYAESDALVTNAGKAGATKKALLSFLQAQRRKGGTRAALALRELRIRAPDIGEEDVATLLKDVFSIADDLNVKADEARGLAEFGDNELRIHHLVNALLLDRFDEARRSQFVREASPASSLEWLVSLAERCKSIKDKRGTDKDNGYENIVDDDTVEWLHDLATERIRTAAKDGSLVHKQTIEGLLYSWKNRTSLEEVRAWTDKALDDDDFVVSMAKDVIRVSHSAAMGGFGSLGDRVSKRTEYLHLAQLEPLLDIARFMERAKSMSAQSDLGEADQEALDRLLKTPERDPTS